MGRLETHFINGPEQSAQLRARPIKIFTQKQYITLNLTAQGVNSTKIADKLFVSKTMITTPLIDVYDMLSATTDLQATLTGLDLDLIDIKALVKGFNPNLFRFLSSVQHEILDTMTANRGAISKTADLATALHRSPNSINTHIGNIFNKIDRRDRTNIATLYKAFKNPAVRTPQDPVIYVQDEDGEPSLTPSDIRLLDLLEQEVPIEKIEPNAINLAAQLKHIRRVIGTPERLEALVNGLRKGVIILPPRTQTAEKVTIASRNLVGQVLKGPLDIHKADLLAANFINGTLVVPSS